MTAAAAASKHTVTSDSSTILIRPYQHADQQQVHDCYCEAMQSLTPDIVGAFLQSPVFLGMFSAWAALVWDVTIRYLNKGSGSGGLFLLVARTVSGAVTAMTTGGNNNNKNERTTITNSNLPIVLFSTALTTVPVVGFSWYLKRQITKYTRVAAESDLKNIDDVYGDGSSHGVDNNSGDNKPKKKGIFLVAVDPSNGNSIVGTVGGESKEETEEGLFELRRMTVLPSQHNKGIGSRLIRSLEAHLSPRRVYLTCSSAQYSAHALYEKNGFRFHRIIENPRMPLIFKSFFRIREYVKEYPSTKEQ